MLITLYCHLNISKHTTFKPITRISLLNINLATVLTLIRCQEKFRITIHNRRTSYHYHIFATYFNHTLALYYYACKRCHNWRRRKCLQKKEKTCSNIRITPALLCLFCSTIYLRGCWIKGKAWYRLYQGFGLNLIKSSYFLRSKKNPMPKFGLKSSLIDIYEGLFLIHRYIFN